MSRPTPANKRVSPALICLAAVLWAAGSAAASGPDTVRLLNINVGNANLLCADVKFNLCLMGFELRLGRNIAELRPHVITLQEVLAPRQCRSGTITAADKAWRYCLDPEQTDESAAAALACDIWDIRSSTICPWLRTGMVEFWGQACVESDLDRLPVLRREFCENALFFRPNPGYLEQEASVRRLLGPDYTMACANDSHHFECIAVLTERFEMAGVPDGALRLDGADTAPLPPQCFGAWSVSAVDVFPRGYPDAAFRVVNAHTDSNPLNPACRTAQVRQIFTHHRYAPGAPRVIVAGDMNLDPYRLPGESSSKAWLEAVTDDRGCGHCYWAHAGPKDGDLDPRGRPVPTAFAGRTLDHVASNAARGSCKVLGASPGTERIDGGSGMDHRAMLCELELFGRLTVYAEDPGAALMVNGRRVATLGSGPFSMPVPVTYRMPTPLGVTIFKPGYLMPDLRRVDVGLGEERMITFPALEPFPVPAVEPEPAAPRRPLRAAILILLGLGAAILAARVVGKALTRRLKPRRRPRR